MKCFNLKLTITQLSYLKRVYGKDMHKALTAYNRGQQGLENYMKAEDERGVSAYSLKVLQFASDFKEEFEKSSKLYEELMIVKEEKVIILY